MTAEQKSTIHSQITEQLEVLRKTIEDLDSEIKPIAPDVSLGRLTRMEAIGAQKVNEAALREARKKVALLERANKRLEENKYGVCNRCGAEIVFGRLVFMPEAETCVEC